MKVDGVKIIDVDRPAVDQIDDFLRSKGTIPPSDYSPTWDVKRCPRERIVTNIHGENIAERCVMSDDHEALCVYPSQMVGVKGWTGGDPYAIVETKKHRHQPPSAPPGFKTVLQCQECGTICTEAFCPRCDQ